MRGCLSRGGLYTVKLRWVERTVLPKIQARVRGALVRKKLRQEARERLELQSSIKIEKVWRGHRGRVEAIKRRRVRMIAENEAEAAIIFQKVHKLSTFLFGI